MFFEAPPAGDEPPARKWPERPPWKPPPLTTLEPVERWARTAGDPPTRPRLSSWPTSSGIHGAGVDLGFSNSALWLWPLPPAEPFEFAVEWPLGGIDLTFTELDGAAIVAAAPRSAFYWPDAEPGLATK